MSESRPDRALNQKLYITLPGKSREDVYVERISGREALGQTYRFEVDAISRSTLTLSSMVGKRAKAEIDVGPETAIVYGIVSSAQSLDPTPNGEYCYRFILQPELGMLRYWSENCVYGTDSPVKVTDIIDKQMTDNDKSRDISYSMNADTSSYYTLDFVLQYRESDLNFVSRLCEKFGIFFFFDQSGDKEMVLFCDRKENYVELQGQALGSTLTAQPPQHSNGGVGDFYVSSFRVNYSTESGTVSLREYDEDTPNVDLSVSKYASFTGQGTRIDYGENYTTQDDGNFLAGRRVDRLETQRLQFTGQSNIPLIRPGVYFTLTNHAISDFNNTEYVVTEVEHFVVQQTPVGFSSSGMQSTPYTNRFTCIPQSTTFRPAMLTPKPVVSGFLIAKIDGSTDGTRPQLDEYGRYRVKFIEDESGLENGQASYLVRKAEPYGGGDGVGAHSTLLVGTEVILAFRGGDPDRPVIVGAVANGVQTSPVTDVNGNVAFLTRTLSGSIFEICDGA